MSKGKGKGKKVVSSSKGDEALAKIEIRRRSFIFKYSTDSARNILEHEDSLDLTVRLRSKQEPWCDGRYDLIGNISHGMSGKITKHWDQRERMYVAIKRQTFNYISANELAVLRTFQHKNIVRYYNHWFERRSDSGTVYLYIVMEYANYDLFDLVSKHGYLDEAHVRQLFVQILDGLNYAHHRGVCHRDLKLENILITSDGKRALIADWGYAGRLNKLLYKSPGSPHYAAPELIRTVTYDGSKVDSWACGVMLYGMATGSLPFNGDNLGTVLINVLKTEPKYQPYEQMLSPELLTLIKRLLIKNYTMRPSVISIRHSSWIQYHAPVLFNTYGQLHNRKYSSSESSIDGISIDSVSSVELEKEVAHSPDQSRTPDTALVRLDDCDISPVSSVYNGNSVDSIGSLVDNKEVIVKTSNSQDVQRGGGKLSIFARLKRRFRR